jgi:acyl carrier protein
MGTSAERQPDSGTRDAAAIEAWIVAWLARELGLEAAAVDAREPLVNFGLGSRQAILMTGDLSDWLGVELEPSLAWDHPTIERLSAFLAEEVRRDGPDRPQR